MKPNWKLTVCALALAAAVLSGLAYGQNNREKPAERSAKSWLVLVDAAKYGQSWDETAQYLKTRLTKDQWVAQLRKVHAQVGGMKSRKLAGARFSKEIPGLPAGNYVGIEYTTVFDKMPSAAEVVLLMLEKNGGWRVVGYMVKPA